MKTLARLALRALQVISPRNREDWAALLAILSFAAGAYIAFVVQWW